MWPEIIAGPIERAGFMDAPQIGPANNASSATTAPIAKPAICPCSLLPCAKLRITNISKKVSNASSISDCVSEPAGNVAPNNADAGKSIFKVALASNAPAV